MRFKLVESQASEHASSEAVGVLQSVAPQADGRFMLTIVNRRGEIIEVLGSDVLAAKIF
ncbi:MAG: hypothetical protein H0V60_06270 [Actinobacteria bacterium]|nr:hypothetical protein [Actinomycetota bacterium]